MGDRQVESRTSDLFGERPVRMPRNRIVLPQEPPELKAAKALATQMRHKRTRRDKKQVAHLICLNLISMLKHRKVGSESTFR